MSGRLWLGLICGKPRNHKAEAPWVLGRAFANRDFFQTNSRRQLHGQNHDQNIRCCSPNGVKQRFRVAWPVEVSELLRLLLPVFQEMIAEIREVVFQFVR